MSALGGLLPPVVAVLAADIAEFSAKMGEAKAEMDGVESTAARTGVLAKAGLMALAGGALAVGAESVHMAMNFDAAMTRINTQDNADLSVQQMKNLRNSVLDLAGPTAQAPDALAEAMIHVYGSGLKGAQALDLLRIAGEGATVGHANLTDVTNALDAAVAVGIPGVQDYRQAMGELNATVGAGDMTMQNLADALGGPMLATVKGYGLNITDVGAGLAVFGDRNIRGAEAATELRMATQALAVPAKAGEGALKSIGLSMTDLRDTMQKGGLKAALNELNDHLLAAGYNSKSAGALITEAFGKKAGGGLNVLMDSLSSSTSNFNDKFKDVAASGKNFAGDWAQTQDTLAFKVKSLGTAAEALGVKLGNVLIPWVTKLLGYLQGLGRTIGEVVSWFKKHQDAAISLGAAIGGVLLYGLYAATGALWDMAAAVVAATWPFLAIGAAIGTVTYGVIYAYKHWAWFRTIIQDVGHFFTWLWGEVQNFVKNFGKIWSAATKPFVDAWNTAYSAAIDAWNSISDFLSGVWDDLVGIWNDTGGRLVSAISDGWAKVSQSVSEEWDKISGDLSQIWGDLTRLWNDTGGKIVTAISNAMHGSSNIIHTVWSEIAKFLTGELDVLRGGIKAAWDAVRGIFQTAWDVISGIVTAAWDLISGTVQAGLDVVKAVLGAGWDVIKGGVQAAWDGVKFVINTALDFIKDTLRLFTDFVTGHWGNLWNDVKKLVSDAWNNIKSFVGSILGDIGRTVSDAAGKLWSGFTGAISDALSGVWNALVSLWHTVIDFFKDAGTWLWQIGKDIIQGLIDGVKSMGSAAWDAVKGVGSGMIDGAKSLLGINSPSIVFHEIGTNIGLGLTDGITGQHRAAAGAATGLAASALAGFGAPSMTATGSVEWSGAGSLQAAGMTGGLATGGSATSAVPALTVEVYLDGDTITGAVRRQVLRYDQRNSGNNLALAGRGFQ